MELPWGTGELNLQGGLPKTKNKSSTAHKLTEVLAGQSTSKPSSDPPQSSTSLAPSSNSEKAIAWKDLRPKGKGRYHPLTSKTSPKPSKNKKIVGFPSPIRGRLSTLPQALKDTLSYDLPVTCAHCNIILPLPTLQKHELINCIARSLKSASALGSAGGKWNKTSSGHHARSSCSASITTQEQPQPPLTYVVVLLPTAPPPCRQTAGSPRHR
ncbi:XIAP-associated factor 1 [Aix galericulata]|nr:XIAP-associated factor 1 [Aix galericulata]